MDVGGYRIDPVIDGEGALRTTDLFPDADEAGWRPHRYLLDPAGRLSVAVGGFLVRGHGRVALVDAGYGPGALGEIVTGRLLASLRALGVRPADVTDVVLTHLHADHVGWLSVDGVPQFPSAVVRCHEADLRHFLDERGDGESAQRLRACRHQLDALADGDRPLPGVAAHHAPGHTPGSMVVVVGGAGGAAVILGDVAHSPVQLLEPGWDTKFDLEPVQARRTRQRLVSELDGSALVAGVHFPGMRFGRLVGEPGRRRWRA